LPQLVKRHVIEKIHALKVKTLSVRAGRAIRTHRAVKFNGPNDLVFQSVRDGKPMRDNNILSRFIKPAARKLLRELALPKNIIRHLAQAARCRHEGHSRTDAPLADINDDGYLRSGHS